MIRYESGCPVWVATHNEGCTFMEEGEVVSQGPGTSIKVKYLLGLKRVDKDRVAPRVTDLESLRMWREES